MITQRNISTKKDPVRGCRHQGNRPLIIAGFHCSGEILEHQDNPWTGGRVKVYNLLNDRIRGELSPEMLRFDFGDGDDLPTLMNDDTALVREDGSAPFILPWQRFGNQMASCLVACTPETN